MIIGDVIIINSNTEDPISQSLKRKAWDEKVYNAATEEEEEKNTMKLGVKPVTHVMVVA